MSPRRMGRHQAGVSWPGMQCRHHPWKPACPGCFLIQTAPQTVTCRPLERSLSGKLRPRQDPSLPLEKLTTKSPRLSRLGGT